MVVTLRSPALWLGIIGAIPGLLIGAIVIVGSISLYFEGQPPTGAWEAWVWFIGQIVFSILGLVGALRIIKKRDTINAGLMILAGVGLLFLNGIGGSAQNVATAIFIALLFFVGGALILLKKG